MNQSIIWNGKWTATTLTTFAKEALEKGFPKLPGIELNQGFRIRYKESLRPCPPIETLMRHREIIIEGRAGKRGKTRITVMTIIEDAKMDEKIVLRNWVMTVQMPISIEVSLQGTKVRFSVKLSAI